MTEWRGTTSRLILNPQASPARASVKPTPLHYILGPVYFHRARLNGAPFQEGDLVEILVGPNRGRLTRVLETWEWRGMVKVALVNPATPTRKSIFWSGEGVRGNASLEDYRRDATQTHDMMGG